MIHKLALARVTAFKLDPLISKLTIAEVSFLLEDALENCYSDDERIDAVIGMLLASEIDNQLRTAMRESAGGA